MSILWLVLGVTACSPALSLIERDLERTVKMAKAYGEESEIRCFEALKSTVRKLAEISKLGADGVVSATYKAWLLEYYRLKARENTFRFCAPVAAAMGAYLLVR